jgi:SAM-dependent methyltransferase
MKSIKKAKNMVLDIMDLRNRNAPLIPPLKFRRIIGQSSNYTDDRSTELKNYCNLRPNDSILDVGCGCGAMVYSLIMYTKYQGNYEGFDIIKDFTVWLTKNITPKYPNFRFQYMDIYNKSYNPSSINPAKNLRFPYEDNKFDIVWLGSVFTHLLPEDLESYLSEIHRVLKPNGKCLISYYLFSNERPNEIKNAEIRSKFVDAGKGYWTTNLKCPEEAVAYDQKYVLSLYSKLKLELTMPIIYRSLQDLIAAKKI